MITCPKCKKELILKTEEGFHYLTCLTHTNLCMDLSEIDMEK